LSFRLASLFGKIRRCNPADNFPFFDSFRTVVSADVEVQNFNGATGSSASEDKRVTSSPETADDQAVQHQGSVSIVLQGAASGVVELEQFGTGQALFPAWSDSHSSTSASTEVMYSMPLHGPSQNAAPAYDLHSYFEPQERSFYDPLGGPAPVVYALAHPAELHSSTATLASLSHAGLASAYPMQLAHGPVDLDDSPPMWATDTPGTHWQSDTPQCDEAQAHPEYPYMTQPYVP
jgi:hypothetical protein